MIEAEEQRPGKIGDEGASGDSHEDRWDPTRVTAGEPRDANEKSPGDD